MTNELIVVKQLPIIEEQLKQIKEQVEIKVNDALSLECTEDTYKSIKKIRSDLNKDFKDFEDKRKDVKSKILSPYEKFELIYKDCITNVFKPADIQLSNKIKLVEDGLKKEKQDYALEFFNEYTASKNIDFLTFDDMHLNITLNASKKSLKDSITATVDKVCDDLAMIDTQEHKAEILVEYKKSLNVSQAILTVNSRIKAIEEEKQRIEEMTAIKEQETAVIEKVEEATFIPPPIEIKQEPIYEMSFKVMGTIENLKKVKEFLISGGYEYEQLN